MTELSRPIVFSEPSPNDRWHLEIQGPIPGRDDSAYLAIHTRVLTVGDEQPPSSLAAGASWHSPFGFNGGPVTVRWDLPDNVAAAYIDSRCYYLLRWGAARRRHRESARVGEENAFTEEDISWFCATRHASNRGRAG